MVKFIYVELYELAILLVVDVAEPVNDFVSIFQLMVFKLGNKSLMFFKRILLILPISLFDGLIRLHNGFDRKLSLQSFSVT